MIWGIFPPLSGWTEATISIFQSSAQTGKPQKRNTDQAGLPIFLTAMLCSWIGQWYSWRVRWESRQSLFSRDLPAGSKAIPSLSLNRTRAFIPSVQWEGPRMLAPVLTWEVDNSYCDLCQNSGAEIVKLWFPYWQKVLMGILLGMLWWVSLSCFF